MTQEKKIFTPKVLHAFCVSVLQGAKVRPAEAEVVASSLVYAELRCVGSHGVIRLESYLKRLKNGLINLGATMPLLNETPACALLDAENGFGQVAGVKAVDLAVAKATAMGVGVVAVRNSNHFGVSAFYAVRATDRNMAAIVFTNAGATMMPYNGTEPLLGTNPFASAVPKANGVPIILDMATSEVAKGKIRKALANGENIPLGWAVDKDGKPTTDPKAALEGTVCPISGAKGAGLALMIDLLSGVLSGSSLTGEVKGVTDTSGYAKLGHLFIVLNPAFFSGAEKFLTDVAAVGALIHRQKPADGGRIYLPGEIEALNEERTCESGITLTASLVDILNGYAERYGAPRLL